MTWGIDILFTVLFGIVVSLWASGLMPGVRRKAKRTAPVYPDPYDDPAVREMLVTVLKTGRPMHMVNGVARFIDERKPE